MFFHVKKLKKNLEVEPKDYGPSMPEKIRRKVVDEVENTSSYRYGFIIKVFNIDLERLEGKLDPTGMLPGGKAIFTVTYDAIVFKPFKKEVLSGIVTTEQKQGLFVQCGPLRVFVGQSNLHSEDNKLRWRAEHSPPCWMSDDGSVIIKEGSHIRVRLIGIRMEDKTIFAVGTILDDYLGPLDNAI